MSFYNVLMIRTYLIFKMGHEHKIVICRLLVLTTRDDIVLMTRFKDEIVSCQEHIISTQRYAYIYIYIYTYIYIYIYIWTISNQMYREWENSSHLFIFSRKKGHFWRLKRQVLILWEKNITSLRLRMI